MHRKILVVFRGGYADREACSQSDAFWSCVAVLLRTISAPATLAPVWSVTTGHPAGCLRLH